MTEIMYLAHAVDALFARLPRFPASAPPAVVLFLDIDGVLHPTSSEIRVSADGGRCIGMDEVTAIQDGIVAGSIAPSTHGLLDPAMCARLAQVLDRFPRTVIVVSSAWRYWCEDDPEMHWLRKHIPQIGDRIIGSTVTSPIDVFWGHNNRLAEIEATLEILHELRPGTVSPTCVILDDRSELFQSISPFYRPGIGCLPCDGRKHLLVATSGEAGLTQEAAEALEFALHHACAA